MNIRIIFCASLMATAFAACSQMDEDQAAWQGSEAVAVGLNSDVEVRLSSGGLATRASIESKVDSFEVDSIGIYMLATDQIRTNPEEVAPIDWHDPRCIKIINEQANAEINDLTGATDLNWADPTVKYWYPYENWYAFRFYGYYPRVNDSDISLQSRYVEASYSELDGTKDIIWGQSKRADMNDATEKYAYSAQYFRQAGHATMYPNVAFNHKLMRIQFYIQGVEDENPGIGYEMANKMVLDSVVLYARNSNYLPGSWDGIPTTAQLVIADLDNPTNEGKLLINWDGPKSTIPMLDENDQPYVNKKQVNNDDLIKVGQPVLLPVPDEGAGTGFLYGAQINLKMVDGGNVVAKFNDASPLDLNLNNTTSGIQAGHTYRVIIKISGPQKVTLNATLTPWEEIDDEGFDDLDLN